MKSAIMKDLYSEIERLKQGIYLSHTVLTITFAYQILIVNLLG